MSSEPLQFFTPIVGRLTHGSTTERRATDQDNRPIPEDKQRFEIGVAFQKAELWPWLTGEWYPYLNDVLARDPNALQRMQGWFQTLKGFSMKVTDGDAPNSKGQTNDNTKGCFVMWFSAIDIKCVNPTNQEIDAADIKRGYFVQVAGNIKPNDQPGDRAGVYLNGNIVRLVAEGDVIVGGMNAEDAFGGTTAPAGALPPGARPLGSNAGVSDQIPSHSAPAPDQTAPAPTQGLPGVPPQTVSGGNAPAPYPNVLDPQQQPQQQQAPLPGTQQVGGVPPIPPIPGT